MSDDDQEELETFGPAEVEEKIEHLVIQGLTMCVRHYADWHMDLALGDPAAEIVADMVKVTATSEGLEGDFPMSAFYQRTMERIDRETGRTHKDGFLLDHVDPIRLPGIDVAVSDSTGIYAAQRFADRFSTERVAGVSREAWEVLLAGPGGEDDSYWEAWDEVIGDALVVDQWGIGWRIWQNGDVFLVPTYMEWSDRDESYVMPFGMIDQAGKEAGELRGRSPVAFGHALGHKLIGSVSGRFVTAPFLQHIETAARFKLDYDDRTDELVWSGEAISRRKPHVREWSLLRGT